MIRAIAAYLADRLLDAGLALGAWADGPGPVPAMPSALAERVMAERLADEMRDPRLNARGARGVN